jgi:AraC-like DNA-binding protein
MSRFADSVFVANAGDGSVRVLRGEDLTPIGRIELGDDADNVRIDTNRKRVLVGYGKGALAVIDPVSLSKTGDIRLKAHPEGFQIDETGTEVFVNVPGAHKIVVNVSPLIRELLRVRSEQPWDYPPASRSSRLARVLLEQLEVHEQAPLELPELSDPRAERVAAMLRADPADRRPLAELASAAGVSHRTIERLFASETGMSFGRWRVRQRMITALEQLAHGDSVSNVAYAVGYETPSSFIAAFRASFGTTPTVYFQDLHDRRASKE